MTHSIRSVIRFTVRLLVLWLVDALSMAGAAWIMPAFYFEAVEQTPRTVVILAAAFLLAVVNLLIRPIVLLLAMPLGWIVTFVIGLLVNAGAIWLTAWLLPGFEVTLWSAFVGGIVIAFFNTVLTGILDVDEEGSWYQNRIERLAKDERFSGSGEPGRGLMIVEIDGLSYWHMQKALADGLLPSLQLLIDEQDYQLSLTDCGLPSMTSSCQAGIMFGDNYDIPAYRWLDKSKQKVYVSASDATELNERYAHGQGLMRHGSSIMNMLNGDAEKSMFTMANMFDAPVEEKRRRSTDIALLMLDPYFLTRQIALFLWETGRELWEAWRQKRNNVWPRLNRLAHGYPFLRAAMCVFMRDISANLAIMDMMRGAPVIYMLYLGYDEVAHHSGPWTDDAFGDLQRLDRTFARLHHVATEKAVRPYDLIILSDHGQSFGPTFKQRYGLTIKELIEAQLPAGTTVTQAIGGDTGANGLSSVAGELANVSDSGAGTAFDQTMAKQGQKLAQAGAKAHEEETAAGELSAVTAYGSGNAAQIYFDLFPRKIKLGELEAAYPGMVDAVVQHEGIGMVLGHEDDDTVVVLGKRGQRNLHTGEVRGEDPVAPYTPESGHGAASIEKRVWQLKRVMEFPNAGDLWVISTVYEDGTVAALEELIGSHGGVGGEQTDAFILHPADMEVTETRNATDVFHLLNNHRNAPVVERSVPVDADIADWAPSNLLAGIRQVRTWVAYAGRCLVLDRDAYDAVARDQLMTGPALLIALVLAVLNSVIRHDGWNPARIVGDLGVWVLAVGVLVASGWLLTRRGDFTTTFRAVGFATSVYILALLALIPQLRSSVTVLILLWGFVALWMAVASAHRTRGWRTLLLPLTAGLVFVVGTIVIGMMVAGLEFTVQGVMQSFGIAPG